MILRFLESQKRDGDDDCHRSQSEDGLNQFKVDQEGRGFEDKQ